MISRKFNCSQQELYAVCNLGWDTCSQNIDKFSLFKPRYAAAFIQARKDEIRDIANMPDSHRRAVAQERFRVKLDNEANSCLNAWRALQRYIQDIWSGDEQRRNLKDAGQTFYNDAASRNWESCQGLFINASNFIRENSAALLANENMPSAFEKEFDTLKTNFETAYGNFNNSNLHGSLLTNEKINANNKLYSTLMAMFKDGREIFRGDLPKQKQFTFEECILQVSGPGVAGIKGIITNGKPVSIDAPIPGLEIQLVETGDIANTEDDGRFLFSQLASGNYTVVVKALGYKEQTIADVKVNTGTYSILNIELVKEAA